MADAHSIYDDPTVEWAVRSVGPHLHPGGEEATALLAQRAEAHGFPSGGRVLDLGSGLGAPARFVARRFVAGVVGLDAEARSQRSARAAAVSEGVHGRCPQVLGVSEALPLRDASFDAAWSQDAMCHMEKAPTVRELARVLRPGALFAFSDWIARARLSDEEAMELTTVWSFPSLLRIEEYAALLDASGFELLLAEDVSELRRRERTPAVDQPEWEASFVRRWGAEVLRRQERRGEVWVALVKAGRAGHGVFIARRRPADG